MAVSPTLKGVFAVLLVMSIGMKGVVLGGNPSPRATAAEITPEARIAAFLERHGFRVGPYDKAPFVPAAAGSCQLLVVLAAPQGWHRDIIRQLASQHDQVSFVFRGSVYQDQPVWRTWTHHYWRRLNEFAGRWLPADVVLGIIASPSCDLQDMPWKEVPRLP